MADPNSIDAPPEYIEPAGALDDNDMPREAPARFPVEEPQESRGIPAAQSAASSAPLFDDLAADQVQRLLAVVKDRGAALLKQVTDEARQRPRLFVGLGLGLTVAALGAGIYGLLTRRPRWQRDLIAYRQALAEGVTFRIRIPRND